MINSNLISQLNTQNTNTLEHNQEIKQKPKSKKPKTQETLINKNLDSYSRHKIENLIDKIIIGIKQNKPTNLLLNTQITKFNISNNLTKDLKQLQDLLKIAVKIEPLLEKELQKIGDILKPMQILNPSQIKTAFENSGIFLESKLKDGLKKEKLPRNFKKLISFIKGVSSNALKEKFIALSQYEMDSATSVLELEKALKNLPKKSYENIKNLNKFANFLQNMKNFLSLRRDENSLSVFDASKSILKMLKRLKSGIEKELLAFKADTPELSRSLKILENTLNKMLNTTYKLELAKDIINTSSNKLSALEILNSQKDLNFIKNNFKISDELFKDFKDGKTIEILKDSEFFDVLKQNSVTLQNQCSSLCRFIRQNMQIFNEKEFENLKLTKESTKLLSLIDKAKNESSKLSLKTDEDLLLELQGDTKAVLLNVKAKTQNEEILDTTNRLLTQIEINQLISVANNSISTYLPYLWDELEHSSVVFKRGNDEKYYAQIKLEFVKLGKIHIFLNMWNEKYLDINIMASDDKFRGILTQNAKTLKENLRKMKILCSGFFIQKLKENNVYSNSHTTNLGLDIKA